MVGKRKAVAATVEPEDFGMPASEVDRLEVDGVLAALDARVWVLEQMHTASPAPYRTKEGYRCSRCQQLITKDMVCGGDYPDECPHKP